MFNRREKKKTCKTKLYKILSKFATKNPNMVKNTNTKLFLNDRKTKIKLSALHSLNPLNPLTPFKQASKINVCR